MLRRRILTRLIFGILGAAGVGVIVFYGVLLFGSVSGEEFSPDSFERRSYIYYELPLVRWKITPVFRNVKPTQLEEYLVKKKYVAQKKPAKRWDLVATSRSGKPWRQGDAKILCEYLDAYEIDNSMTSFWETWTKDHPKLAQVLWPEIVTLARANHYFLIPHLFDLAQHHDQPQQLQEDIKRLLAEQYDLLAATAVESSDLEAAIDYYSKALEYQPGRLQSLKGRATCHDQLGNVEKANEDRAALDQKSTDQAEEERP